MIGLGEFIIIVLILVGIATYRRLKGEDDGHDE